jgi:hypothetical protein
MAQEVEKTCSYNIHMAQGEEAAWNPSSRKVNDARGTVEITCSYDIFTPTE